MDEFSEDTQDTKGEETGGGKRGEGEKSVGGR